MSASDRTMSSEERQRLGELLAARDERDEARFERLRATLRLQEHAHAGLQASGSQDDDVVQLDALATDALGELGNAGEPATWSLRDYDAEKYGPLFGVSDDGSNAPVIVDAFLASPKAAVLRERSELSPLTLGAAVDAERMSAAGELLVGPAEYASVRRAAAGRTAMTTNVGTVVLPRLYRVPPFVTVEAPATVPLDDAITNASSALAAIVDEFDDAVGGSRPVTVFVVFRSSDDLDRSQKLTVLRALRASLDEATGAGGRSPRLGLLQRADGRSSRAPNFAIGLAADAGLQDVLIEGDARFESQDQLMLPGLLAFFNEDHANEIIKFAAEKSVSVNPKNRLDLGTAARTIWSGLSTARSMGLHLGKFGLFPLTIEEQFEVMRRVGAWFPSWTAAPAFYVDRPIVTGHGVRRERELTDVACAWITEASRHGFQVVLVDSPDRTPAPAGSSARTWDHDRGRRLLRRSGANDIGVLELDDVRRISAHAARCEPPVRVLWAGGLSGQEAADLATLGAFGIFTTSTTARSGPAPLDGDPSNLAQLQPTYLGVLTMKMLIEAAFLAARRRPTDASVATELDGIVARLLALIESGDTRTDATTHPVLEEVSPTMQASWLAHLGDRETT